MANTKRDNQGRFASGSFMGALRDRPYAAAGVAAGVAAASAFLWSRRGQIGNAVDSGMDRLSEMKAERMRARRSQVEIAEEAMTLKETGENKRSKGPRGPIAQQEIKAGLATVS